MVEKLKVELIVLHYWTKGPVYGQNTKKHIRQTTESNELTMKIIGGF